MKREYTIDGTRFSTLEEFYDEISSVLVPSAEWGHNLDAFNDILKGGFGTPEEGFILRWRNSKVSQHCLGYSETIRQLEKRLERCHTSNRENVAKELVAAKNHEGPVVFSWLVEIIKEHGLGGNEAEDGVELILE